MGFFGSNPNKGYSSYGDVTKTSGSGNHGAGLPLGYRVTNIYQTANGTYGFQDTSGDVWYSQDGKNYSRHTSHGRDTVQVSGGPSEPKEEESSSGESSGGGGGGGGGGGYYPTNPTPGNTGNAYFDTQSLAMMEMIKSLTASIEALGKVDDLKSDIEDVSKGASGLESTLLTGSSYIPSEEKKKKSHLTPIVVG